MFAVTYADRNSEDLTPAEIAIESPTMARCLMELNALRSELELLEERVTSQHDLHRKLTFRIRRQEAKIQRYTEEWNRRRRNDAMK